MTTDIKSETSTPILDLGTPDVTEIKKENDHVPSAVMPDTLLTFTDQLKWLIKSLKQKMISPRYCEEPLGYLNIPEFERMAFPMKCFCDINLHKLGIHMDWYGYYGLAFSKEWGMEHKVQPIQYINEDSDLIKDFSTAFYGMLQEDEATIQNETQIHTMLKNYALHELMYYKPYQGNFEKRTTHEVSLKCFADECEWRFIPDVSVVGMPPIITQNDLVGRVLDEFNKSLDGVKEVSLPFDYSELKYVIVKSISDYENICAEIDSWNLVKGEKYTLLSKIMVWDNMKEDF